MLTAERALSVNEKSLMNHASHDGQGFYIFILITFDFFVAFYAQNILV